MNKLSNIERYILIEPILIASTSPAATPSSTHHHQQMVSPTCTLQTSSQQTPAQQILPSASAAFPPYMHATCNHVYLSAGCTPPPKYLTAEKGRN